MKPINGFALVSAMLMLLVLTTIALSLTSQSRSSSQLSSASVAREMAMHRLSGSQENFLSHHRENLSDSVFVTNDGIQSEYDPEFDVDNVTTFRGESGCRRSLKATSSSLIGCRQAEVQSAIQFGYNEHGRAAITSGIEQPVLLAVGG